VWKDEQKLNIGIDMHSLPTEGNLCDDNLKAVKLTILQGGAETVR
jgi:hypothetical protein